MSSDDLEERLRLLGATTAPVKIAPDRVWRAHRWRRWRDAGGAGVALVGLAFTAAALPIAAPDFRSSTVMSADAGVASNWPARRLADATFACNESIVDVVDPAGDAELHIVASIASEPASSPDRPETSEYRAVEGATLPSSARWWIRINMQNDSTVGLHAGADWSTPPEGWLARDGRIVGRLTMPVALTGSDLGPEPLTWAPGGTHSVDLAGRMQECAAGAPANEPLPTGQYSLYVTRALTTVPVEQSSPDNRNMPVRTADEFITLVGGPWTVTVQP